MRLREESLPAGWHRGKRQCYHHHSRHRSISERLQLQQDCRGEFYRKVLTPGNLDDRIANCICAYVFGFLISKHMGMRCDREPLETSPTSERFTAPSQHTSHIELLTSALCRHIRKHIFSFFSHETLTLLTPTTVSSMRSQVLQSDVYRSRAYDSSTGTTNMYYGKDYSAFLVIMPGKAMMPAYRFGHVRSGA
jgi:hypothetical protein